MRNPKTFNEKLQVLKLKQRSDPRLPELVDKYSVRSVVEQRVGKEVLIPMIGAWDDPIDIPWDELPKSYVLKVAHGSGYNIVVEDRKRIDPAEATEQLKEWQKINHYHIFREYPYNSVQPRIVCEEFLCEDSGESLRDYKFFCFDGEPIFIEVDIGRIDGNHRRNFYDTDWNLMDFQMTFPRYPGEVKRPRSLEQMCEITRKLSRGLPFARVDLYEVGAKPYFGEITLYPAGALATFEPAEYDEKFGAMIPIAQTNK